jgi:hypothetical protein
MGRSGPGKRLGLTCLGDTDVTRSGPRAVNGTVRFAALHRGGDEAPACLMTTLAGERCAVGDRFRL